VDRRYGTAISVNGLEPVTAVEFGVFNYARVAVELALRFGIGLDGRNIEGVAASL
jgi:hypothetical protein